jgi:hypothetical protein
MRGFTNRYGVGLLGLLAILLSPPDVLAQRTDMRRFNALTSIPVGQGDKTHGPWTIAVPAGKYEFSFEGTKVRCKFTPGNSIKTAKICFIQVARSGNAGNWYNQPDEVKLLSREAGPHTVANAANFVARTGSKYGFRVDRDDNENTPFWGQTVIKKTRGYKIGFANAKQRTTNGSTIEITHPLLERNQRTYFLEKGKTHRMYFMLSAMNYETGELYGTIDYALKIEEVEVNDAPSDMKFTLYKAALVPANSPELLGRDEAFKKWNNGFTRRYTPRNGTVNVIYKIPGEGRFWAK